MGVVDGERWACACACACSWAFSVRGGGGESRDGLICVQINHVHHRAGAGPSNPRTREPATRFLAFSCLLVRHAVWAPGRRTAIFSRGAVDASMRGEAMKGGRLRCRRVAAGGLWREPAARVPRSSVGFSHRPAAPLRYSAPRPPPFSEVRDRHAGPGLLLQDPGGGQRGNAGATATATAAAGRRRPAYAGPRCFVGQQPGPGAGEMNSVSNVSSVSWTGAYPTLDGGCRDVGGGRLVL